MGSGMKWEDEGLLKNLQTFNTRADRALTASITYHAGRAEAYAKRNAPWRDRTSNARNGLFATARRKPPSYRIIVGHSVPYGIWLEVANSGRYQIIRPTIDHEGPELMKTVSKMFSVMF